MSSFTFCTLNWPDPKVIREINALMCELHSKSEPLTEDDLILILNTSVVAIATRDGVVVGVSVLRKADKLSIRGAAYIETTFTSVDESQMTEVFGGLVSVLVDRARKDGCVRVDVSLGEKRPQREEIVNTLVTRGFRLKPATRLRLVLES